MFEDLKDYAKINKVPIIKDEGMEFLLSSIKKYDIQNILEIGTAIGYSAIRMASIGPTITTLERNDLMYKEALSNIGKYNLNSKIEAIFTDALVYTPTKTYDMIFIDAAKAQNQKFFLRFTPFLKKGGIVIIDNLLFHGLTENVEKIESKNLRSMVKKINLFKDWLKENKEYNTEFFSLGDGMSLSIKL